MSELPPVIRIIAILKLAKLCDLMYEMHKDPAHSSRDGCRMKRSRFIRLPVVVQNMRGRKA